MCAPRGSLGLGRCSTQTLTGWVVTWDSRCGALCCLKGSLRAVSFPAEVLLLWAALHKTACFHLGNAAFPASSSHCVLRKGVEMTPTPWRQETWRLAKLPEMGFACTRHYRHSLCCAGKPSWTSELLQLTSHEHLVPERGASRAVDAGP